MKESLIVEKSEKPQRLERLSICLRIVAIVSLLVGAYLLLTNSNTNSTSAPINPGMQTIIDNIPLIEIGMTSIISLVLLILAFINRKNAPKFALIVLIIGITIPLIVWYLHISFPQPHIAPVLD